MASRLTLLAGSVSIKSGKQQDPKVPAARAFVHGLNVLLKYVRLYGFEHQRTEAQFQLAWKQLQTALSGSGNAGFVLSVSGNKLMLDGAALESGQAERGFAQLLSAAALASIQFMAGATADDLSRLVRAFAINGPKGQAVGEQVRTALAQAGTGNIKVNQLRFVAADPNTGEVSIAAQLAAQNLGPEFKEWLNDPQKLLELIAAAENTPGGVERAAVPQAGAAGAATAPGYAPLQEDEIAQAVRILAKFGELNAPDGAGIPELDHASVNIKAALRQILEKTAAESATSNVDSAPMLMKAAERMAIQYALERYERGEVKVNAVHDMMERMTRQMDTLRSVLKVHEDKLSRAGMLAESHADILDRQFWAEVPDAGKRAVLLSNEAACVPPRNVRSFVEEVLEAGDQGMAAEILHNYCEGLASNDPGVQRKAAVGLHHLADLYAGGGDDLLNHAVNVVSERISAGPGPELQPPLSAAFVRLGQEAGKQRAYKPVRRILFAMKEAQTHKPSLVEDLRPRIGLENRLADFIEDSLQLPAIPADLVEVLREVPQAATEHIAERFARCRNLQECDRLVDLVGSIGAESAEHLRQMLRRAPDRQAATAVGLLSRVDSAALLESLPVRLREWNRFYHDFTVAQIALGNAPERGQILWELIDELDHLVLPIAMDEIGLSGDNAAAPGLMVLAGDGASESRSPLLRLKAIEALGRLRESSADPLLRGLIETRKMWKWVYPRELRIAAAQALLKIDPEYDSRVLAAGGLEREELSMAPLDADDAPRLRYRRYDRVTPHRVLQAVASSNSGRIPLAVRQMSLNGGLVTKDDKLRFGSEVSIDLQAGLRHIRGQVIMRRNQQGDLSFEIVDMELEERLKLRRLLLEEMQPR
jgi:hypothetical protein